jgi:hypothetical protein
MGPIAGSVRCPIKSRSDPRPIWNRFSKNRRSEGSIRIRTLLILIALAAAALAAWVLVPPWWQYHQSIKTLTD